KTSNMPKKKQKSYYKPVAKKDKLPTSRTPEVMEEHQSIIMTYFTNGFNGQLAVKQFRPHLSDIVAANVWQGIKNNPNNKAYLEDCQARLSSQVDLKAEHITKELISYGYSDITNFAGLTVDELKELPPEQRRQIQAIDITDTYDKHGNYTGQTVKIKLVPKLDSLKELAKHIGYYSLDNDQKANKINILQVLKDSNPDTLNT